MSKFVETTYTNKKEILKFPDHYVNMAITVSDEGISPNAEGKKIVPAGTILGGGFLLDESINAVAANDAGAEGVLFNDTDVTYGPAPGAALLHGFVALDKLPQQPTPEAIQALRQVTFLK
ncbi:hypothetical protein I6G82_02625 [Lysinibacillus macroides]|uniref:Prophage protein n=1 Tax=Lysinibacillus macroides TaxID=33935 RepID=A0A0M9DJ81_9BACI|nr:hypothetical protein [Lysinibacillus macroides]KOY81292.1 prophage protein [Lysinibacillus macroides]QPR68546.1 hypothetical protein I6G82_02625 [Lysinibacillus macroides]